MNNSTVYVGTYTSEENQSAIHILAFDCETGKLEIKKDIKHGQNASFLSAYGTQVLAVNEMEENECIYLYQKEENSNQLQPVAQLYIEGVALCHLHRWGKSGYFSAANYMSGDFVICKEEEKKLQLIQQVKHHGVGFDKEFRQDAPHVHSTLVTPDGRELLVADLGLDQVFVYQIDPESSRVVLDKEEKQIKFPLGEGPRHMVFSNDGRYFVTITEMGNKIFIFKNQNGKFELVHFCSTLPENFEGESIAADIHFSPDGKFLYASNRGADTIAAYSFDVEKGEVEMIGQYDVKGHGPRNFCISPSGRYCLIANQYSGNVVVLRRDVETGILKEKCSEVFIPNAVFVSFDER